MFWLLFCSYQPADTETVKRKKLYSHNIGQRPQTLQMCYMKYMTYVTHILFPLGIGLMMATIR